MTPNFLRLAVAAVRLSVPFWVTRRAGRVRGDGDLPSCALPQRREDVVARGALGKIPFKKGEECERLALRQPIRIPSGSFRIFSMQQHIAEPVIGLYNERWQPQLQLV